MLPLSKNVSTLRGKSMLHVLQLMLQVLQLVLHDLQHKSSLGRKTNSFQLNNFLQSKKKSIKDT